MPSRWFLIVHDGACPECGFVASSVSQEVIGDAIVEEARRWSDLLDAPREFLSVRPSPGVWSALEYAGHVRDTIALFDERIRLAIAVDNPGFEYQDPETAVVDRRYNDEEPREVAAALQANSERFAQMLVTLPADAWSRGGTRLEGEFFDISLMARFALHEANHHRVDAERSVLG